MLLNNNALMGAKMEEPAMFNNSTVFTGNDFGEKILVIIILD